MLFQVVRILLFAILASKHGLCSNDLIWNAQLILAVGVEELGILYGRIWITFKTSVHFEFVHSSIHKKLRRPVSRLSGYPQV